MAYDLLNKLVIGVASSALFDLTDSNAFFEANGEAAYRKYQADRIDDVLDPGVAFGFIKKLLGLNKQRPEDPLVEVIILSQNDPSTGLRVMRSVESHRLPITRAVFTQGEAPYAYIGAFSMSLFLSARGDHVRAAMALGFPAGLVVESATAASDDDTVRVALDFDGVIASDEAERIYQSAGGITAFQANEVAKRTVPLGDGPLREFLKDLNMIQETEAQHASEDDEYKPKLRVSIVTARNAPAHERAVNTLDEWGVTVNDAFFLGGIDKGTVLEVMRPDIYFDDQQSHLDSTSRYAASVLIPYGITNETTADPEVSYPLPPAEPTEAEAS